MGFFTPKKDITTEEREHELAEIERLSEEIARLSGEVKALRAERENIGDITALKAEINELEISKSKLEEANKREVREVEHRVGLLQEKMNQDIDLATRTAEVTVREGNLDAERKRFEDHTKFVTDQMRDEMSRFEKITEKLLDNLPDMKAALSARTIVKE